jgi:hypothetical protein
MKKGTGRYGESKQEQQSELPQHDAGGHFGYFILVRSSTGVVTDLLPVETCCINNESQFAVCGELIPSSASFAVLCGRGVYERKYR